MRAIIKVERGDNYAKRHLTLVQWCCTRARLRLTRFSLSTPIVVCITAALTFLLIVSNSKSAFTRVANDPEHRKYKARESRDWLFKYEAKHAFDLKRLRKGESVKVLVYTCHGGCGGLGDRLSGMLSAFYVAVATERLFLIDHTSPVHLNITLLPANINWNAEYLVGTAGGVTINLVDTGDPMRSFAGLFKAHDQDVQILRLQINRFYVGIALWTPKIEGLPLESEYRYVGRMYELNGHHALETKEVFHIAFRALFVYSAAVVKRAGEMMTEMGLENFESSAYVGVHARMGGGSQSSAGAVAWEDPQRHSLQDANDFIACARSKFSQSSPAIKARGDAPILVFSDSIDFKKLAAEIDPNVRYVKSTVLFHIDRSTANHRLVRQGNVDTYAELYILSRAKCVVGSSSTFSAIAATTSHNAYDKMRCYCIFQSCELDRVDFFEDTERSKVVFQVGV